MKVKTLSISSHLEGPHKGAPMYVVASFWAIKCKEGRARPKKGVTRVVRVISLPQWTLFFGRKEGLRGSTGNAKLDQANARQLSCAVRQT